MDEAVFFIVGVIAGMVLFWKLQEKFNIKIGKKEVKE